MKLELCSNVNHRHAGNCLRSSEKETSKHPSTAMDTREFLFEFRKNFITLSTLCSAIMSVTRVVETDPWTVTHVGQSTRK